LRAHFARRRADSGKKSGDHGYRTL
jgi:hypothetical protein